MKFDVLEWDSKFFGFGVARITEPHVLDSDLSRILEELSEKNIRLVYWASDISIGSEFAARNNNGFHADRKTVFVRKISSKPELDCGDIEIKEYSDDTVSEELQSLAVQAGLYSRYTVDPNMPQNAGDRMYSEWIKNSVNHSLADAVLVAYYNSKMVGMVTVGDKNDVGDIGLIAVDSTYRGQKIGSKLVVAAQRWFVDYGYTELQVVTQGDNNHACSLYEKCGYIVGEVSNFYHFWL